MRRLQKTVGFGSRCLSPVWLLLFRRRPRRCFRRRCVSAMLAAAYNHCAEVRKAEELLRAGDVEPAEEWAYRRAGASADAAGDCQGCVAAALGVAECYSQPAAGVGQA